MMLSIDSKEYYLDLKAIDDIVSIVDETEDDYDEVIVEIYRVEDVKIDPGKEDGDEGMIAAFEVLDRKEITKQKRQKRINQAKYELIMNAINILAEARGGDEKLGNDLEGLSIGERIAFNTLYRYKILTDKIKAE